jgi:hypothetical protein
MGYVAGLKRTCMLMVHLEKFSLLYAPARQFIEHFHKVEQDAEFVRLRKIRSRKQW